MTAARDLLRDRWDDVDRLFLHALDLPDGERERWLAEACGTDGVLRETLRSLLLASELPDARLAGPGPALLREACAREDGPSAPEVGGLRPGDLLGRYRITAEIGRGGMATVYAAERADGEFRQTVAVKVLRPGLDTEEVVRRFVAERQILSGLSHPNVARLLDGGSTEEGRPFLVMELVEGETITAWADRRRLPVRERLRLFLQVAEAVDFAHRHLVVHRDLKPSNVLVGADCRVRLLDFGSPGCSSRSRTAARSRGPGRGP